MQIFTKVLMNVLNYTTIYCGTVVSPLQYEFVFYACLPLTVKRQSATVNTSINLFHKLRLVRVGYITTVR